MPRISVIIPTFNRANFLEECLESILGQTLPASQIVVVNDGSTDQTRSVLRPFMKAIEYHETDQLGKPGALNYGLERVTGDYLWIFDDDDVALPDALKRFVEPLERSSDLGFSFSSYYFSNTRKKNDRIGSIRSELGIPDLKRRGFLIPLLEWNFLGGAALFARTSCYKNVGNFNSRLLRSQDYEMAIRIVCRYKGIQIEGEPTFHYRQHDGLRGPDHDRFVAPKRSLKWLEYDQMFFRELYEDVPLVSYLSPRNNLESNVRHAIIQRMAIMSYKLLLDEVIDDFKKLAQLCNESPITDEEYLIVRKMFTESYYEGVGNIYDKRKFFDAIRQLSRSSNVIRLLRKKFFRAIFARLRIKPGLREFFKAMQRIIRLYF